ncbi:Deubiquitinating protein VCIP135 [Frankliniella fusca]|uniref:Deubiquitinating protein VCIP135 n=1 Tax=Frankliniella fusca TaxID=407009 RepID=A0AAE1HLA0_9NEOP|nr:Deubiquitinating protein VCIP135 [Frankliniella fusca]
MLSSAPPGRIFSGTCPADGCSALVIFSDPQQETYCLSCKSKHPASSVLNPSVIRDSSEALAAFLKVFSDIPSTHEPSVTKVYGLSTYHCKLLSPLLTIYGIDRAGRAKTIHELKNCATFDCSWLGDRSFCIDPDHITLPEYGQDESGSVRYLSGTLSLLRSFNNERDALVPLHVDGDGHCLVHAVSRALVGRELFWHALRTGLKQHLTENLPQYKELLNDFINSSEWEDIIAECDPEYSPRDNEILGLRNIHIFGLANVLKRPILLVDSVAGMQSSGDYSALFLPGLIPPDQCRDRHGELNKPICLAWSSSGRNHYIPLVGIRGCAPPLFPRTLLPKVWGVPQSTIENYIEFNENDCLVIGGGKTMQDSYLSKLASGMDALFHQKQGVDPSLVADTYYSNFKRGAAFDMKPAEVIHATKLALQQRRLVRCLQCSSVNILPLNSEWLRPHGILYKIAKMQSSGGILQDNREYIFSNYGITCVYNARKDMLIVEKSPHLDKCSWCESDQLRLVHFDGKILYENGDKTTTKVNSPRARCKCGYKHWYNGREYDNPPLKIPISFEWKSRKIVDEVLFFQDESDPSLNTDPNQIAAFIVHKHLPGERDTSKVRQIVLELLVGKTKYSVPTSTQSRPESDRSLDLDPNGVEKQTISEIGLPQSPVKSYDRAHVKDNEPAKLSLSKSIHSISTPKKRHSDTHGGALPKQRSTPASLAAAAAISRAEASCNPASVTRREKETPVIGSVSEKREESVKKTIRLGPGYSVISNTDSDEMIARQKLLEDALKTTELLTNYFASFSDHNTYSSRNQGQSKTNSTTSSSASQRVERSRKADPAYGSLSRVANLLNVGGDRSDCEDVLSSEDEGDV